MNKTTQLRKIQAIHQDTAEQTLDKRQKVVFLLLVATAILAVFVWRVQFAVVALAVTTVITAIIVCSKLCLGIYALSVNGSSKVYPSLTDQLPLITVLGSHYLEGRVLARWVRNISQLDWPTDKLEVLMLIRQNDLDTIGALVKIVLPANFRVIWIEPKDYGSKPAALNVGLDQASGEYIAIFDSENGPARNQLKKQFAALANSPDNVAFAQSYPVVSNWKTEHWWQNVLPKIEAAEYTSYYHFVNRRLVDLGLFSPLPGNSILFKTDALLAVGKYDRHNKTEDAEIAVKFARRKWRGIFVDSETTEESPISYRNFEGRRRRWTHGFIQTWLIAMRHPILLLKEMGVTNFVIFQLTIGGSPFVQLVNPLLWGLSLTYWVSLSLGWEPGTSFVKELYPWPVMYLAVLTSILGVLLISFYSIIAGIMKRQMYENVWVAYMFIPYNFLISFASYKSIYDLVTKAGWHKTGRDDIVETETPAVAVSSQEAAG